MTEPAFPFPGVHPEGLARVGGEWTRPFTIQQLVEIGLELMEQFLARVVNAVVGVFIPGVDAFSQLQSWANDIGSAIEGAVQVIIDLIGRLLAPFGANTGLTDLPTALNKLVLTMSGPWQLLATMGSVLEEVIGRQDSEIASLRAQVNAMRLALDPTVNEDGGWDPCRNADGFDSPFMGVLTPTGWGALTSQQKTVAHYSDSPTTPRCRVGMWVKAKRVGKTLLYFCSNDAATNWAGLELEVTGTGDDQVTLVTGTGPYSGLTTRRSMTMRIPTDSFWEIAYEPLDETGGPSNTFYVFLGREPLVPLTWTDEGNVVIHGDDDLRWGIGLNGLNHPTRRGFDVTDVSYRDWLDGAPQ